MLVWKALFEVYREPDEEMYIVAPTIESALACAQAASPKRDQATFTPGRPVPPHSIAVVGDGEFSHEVGNSDNHCLYLTSHRGQAVFVSAVDVPDAVDEYKRWMIHRGFEDPLPPDSIQRIADSFLRAT